MRNFMTIMRRDFMQLVCTPAIYCVLAAITLFYSFVFYSNVEQTRQALLEPVTFIFGVLSIFFVPVITMRSFAGEENSGTIEILLTAPVRPIEVVLGKFAGCWLFYTLTMLPLAGYIGIFAVYGEIDRGTVAAGIFGLWLVGGAQIATGLFTSSLSGNIIVAAGTGCVANFFFFMLALPAEGGAGVYSFPAQLSWWAHFKEVFSRGLLDTRSLLYFASFIGLLLFLLWLNFSSRGMFARGGGKLRRGYALACGLCLLLAVNIFVFAGWAGHGWQGMSALIAAGELAGRGWPLGLSALLLLAAGLLLIFGRKRQAAAPRRWLRALWPVWLSGLSAILIFANLNYLTNQRIGQTRLYKRWDLSDNQINTLSPRVREALDNLEDQLTITMFLSENADYDGVPLARRMRDIFSEMASYSPRVRVHYFDALARTEEARKEGTRLELPLPDLAKLLVFEYGGKRLVLQAESFLRAPEAHEMMAGINRAAFQGELTTAIAIRRISDQRIMQALFTTGHGEYNMTRAGRDPQSCGSFAEALRLEAWEVRNWMLRGNEDVPAGCDLLVIAAPTLTFRPEAVQKVEEYLDRGGRVMILLPSTLQVPGETGLEKILISAGLRMREDIVIDQQNNYSGEATQILALMQTGAAFETGLTQTVLALPDARSLLVNEEQAEKNGWRLWRQVRSLRPSQRLYPKSKRTLSGASTIMVAAARPAQGHKPEARLLVSGCAAFSSNLYIDAHNNRHFLIRACGWLSGRHYNIAVEERKYSDYQLNINTDGLRLVWWLAVVALPELWLLCALLVWRLRRD